MSEIKVRELFESKYGKDYRMFAAPGRINLIGEHTDYNEGFVMPAAIDKRIYLAISPAEGSKAGIYSADYNEDVNFDIGSEAMGLPQWALYPYGVVKELQKQGLGPGGFRAVFAGDIPGGAGLSSSAALESAFALALNTLFDLGADNFALAKIGQMAEHNYAGVRCGIMDQFASFFGMKDKVIKLDCRSLEHEYFPLELDGHQLLLADTRVKHSLASSAYNQRRHQCEEGAAVIGKDNPGVKSLRDVSPELLQSFRDNLDQEVYTRCEYVIEENSRVLATCQALESGSVEKTGELMYQSHKGLREKYEVSCRELDLLVDIAAEFGIAGARMMGGGFGGCTINLLRSGKAGEFREKASEEFRNVFGHPPVFYNVSTGDGAKEIL